MEFGFSEEQEMLRAMARDFLEKECPTTLVREIQEGDKGYSPDLWQKIAELGWLGLVLPEEYGGSGGDFVDLIVLLEEMGRALVPGPFLPTVVLGVLPILWAGTEEQKSEFLPKIAEGAAILTMAYMEPSARYDAKGIQVRAAPDNGGYVINGTKLFVPGAHVADYLLSVVRTRGNGKDEDGISLLLVDAKSPGISITPLKTVAVDKQCEVIFNEVRVPRENVLAKQDQGWEIVARTLQHAAIAECAVMLGAARRALEMTIDYAKERIQYGRPIGSFQAYQHKCGEMASDVEGSKNVTYQAAWRLSQNLRCTREVSIAKAWVNEACSRACNQACYLHGAIGYSQDHDAPLYLRRVRAGALTYGNTNYHQEIVARELIA